MATHEYKLRVPRGACRTETIFIKEEAFLVGVALPKLAAAYEAMPIVGSRADRLVPVKLRLEDGTRQQVTLPVEPATFFLCPPIVAGPGWLALVLLDAEKGVAPQDAEIELLLRFSTLLPP